MFSPDTIQLFEELLNSYQLPANHPQFNIIAARIISARNELAQWHLSQEPASIEDVPEEDLQIDESEA